MQTLTRKERISRFGWKLGLMGTALGWIRRKIGIEIWLFVRRPLRTDFTPPAEHAQRFKFRVLTQEEALNLAGQPDPLVSQEFVLGALSAGSECLGAFADAELAGFAWYCFTRQKVLPGIELIIRDNEYVYGCYSYVAPEHRGIRLNHTLMQAHDRGLLARGKRFTFGYLRIDNLPQLKSLIQAPDQKFFGFALIIPGIRKKHGYLSPGLRSITTIRTTPPAAQHVPRRLADSQRAVRAKTQ